jgi:alcohol dehydrogenase YqhD (iron-dependent ADH family)|tara:strand:- start:969 stop:1145 length:177 start_codon:yes stop_codon:yes gene_type:complete
MRQNGVRSNVRFPYGGSSIKKQGANDRLDESLGMRRGKESTKTQSYKSRRDESRGASK